jgi:hypothetical protein
MTSWLIQSGKPTVVYTRTWNHKKNTPCGQSAEFLTLKQCAQFVNIFVDNLLHIVDHNIG